MSTREAEGAAAYPLSWPPGRPRTPEGRRGPSRFGGGRERVSLGRALNELREEMRLLRADRVVVSTNIPVRQDGLPYASARLPADPGVAVYFQLKRRPYVLACDRWDRLPDNLTAIARHVEALRGQERWGVGGIEEAFAGYLALPSMPARKPWWQVLGFTVEPPPSMAHVEEVFVGLAARHHPDRGGSSNTMAELNAARDEARRHYEAP